MATVYLAIQDSFGRHVALKIMSDQLGEDNVWARRFIKEAQIVAQLSHPNIVPVFDVGTHEGKFYISMENMKGGDLEGKMAKGIAIPDVIKIIVGVAAGLDFAGEKGFVHRDIKPDNVMFREDGSPVILDFGIVKQKGGDGDKMTQTGTIVGTTAYMSPEQAQGKELDERSDIYSLGVMFYELLTGRVPFQGDSAVAVLLKHVNEPPPPLPEFLSVFQPVIDKSLAKKVEDRYSRAREMIEHLQELEPEIRGMMAQQQAMFAGGGAGADDATNVQSAISDDATIQTEALDGVSGSDATAATVAIQAHSETELTDVLSSAKATIDDFSEEALARKARRTKQTIIAASFVAILALGYVGFQQFYIAPKERAAAELKLKQQEQARQLKIDELVQSARDASKGLYYSNLETMDRVIGLYREVLRLDPENQVALNSLETFGTKYIELANTALEKDDLELAETYRDYAEQLVPQHPDLASLRAAMTEARAESTELALQAQFKQQQVDTLLENAQKDISAGKTFSPAGDNAYAKLQQVLKIDASNAQASQMINGMLNDLYSTTESQISKGSLSSAKTNLTLLESYYEDAAALAVLQSSYDDARRAANQRAKAASAEKRKEELLTKAANLKRERRTITINAEMRDLYMQVLDMDSANAKALAGMDDTSQYEAELAKEAIDQRDFDRAAEQIAVIKQYTPRHSSIRELENQLKSTKKSSEKADKLIASAEQLTVSTNTGDAKREDLLQAYNYLDSARTIDDNNPNLFTALTELETEYIVTIKQLINNKEDDLANAYFNDTANKEWPSDRIFELQMAQQSAAQKEKPKPKRVLTGGF